MTTSCAIYRDICIANDGCLEVICRSLQWITANLDDKYVIICIKAKETVDKHIYVVAIFSLKVWVASGATSVCISYFN